MPRLPAPGGRRALRHGDRLAAARPADAAGPPGPGDLPAVARALRHHHPGAEQRQPAELVRVGVRPARGRRLPAAVPHHALPHHQRPDRAAKGLLNKQLLATPADRVRTVDVTSSPIHRVLGLGKVELGTAGTGHGDRLVLDALTLPEAHHLRDELIHLRQARAAPEASTGIPAGPPRPHPPVSRMRSSRRSAAPCRVRSGGRHRDRAAPARPAVGPLRAGDDDRGRVGAGHLRLREPVHHPRPRAGRAHRGVRPDRRLRLVGRLDRRGRRAARRRHRAVGHRLPPAVLGVPAVAAQRRHAARHPRPADQPRDEHRGEADPRPRGRRAARAAAGRRRPAARHHDRAQQARGPARYRLAGPPGPSPRRRGGRDCGRRRPGGPRRAADPARAGRPPAPVRPRAGARRWSSSWSPCC